MSTIGQKPQLYCLKDQDGCFCIDTITDDSGDTWLAGSEYGDARELVQQGYRVVPVSVLITEIGMSDGKQL